MTSAPGTPVLCVSPSVRIRRTRRLPVDGEVLVRSGDTVRAADWVAFADLPGRIHPVPVARHLGIAAAELLSCLSIEEGAPVTEGEVIATKQGFFGFLGFGKKEVRSPCAGVTASVSPVTGQVMIAEAATPYRLPAYLPGRVVQADADGVVEIDATVSLIQGIFGAGGERFGRLRYVERWPSAADPESVEQLRAAVLFSEAPLREAGLFVLKKIGVAAAISGSVPGSELMRFAGRTLNPACTGVEGLDFSLVITEGFGRMPMASRTAELLHRLDGSLVSLNGAVQVRAGVIRPEIIGPALEDEPSIVEKRGAPIVGDTVRIVRGERFGELGKIYAVPEDPLPIDSGAEALVFEVKLSSGEIVRIPRVNAEQF